MRLTSEETAAAALAQRPELIALGGATSKGIVVESNDGNGPPVDTAPGDLAPTSIDPAAAGIKSASLVAKASPRDTGCK